MDDPARPGEAIESPQEENVQQESLGDGEQSPGEECLQALQTNLKSFTTGFDGVFPDNEPLSQ